LGAHFLFAFAGRKSKSYNDYQNNDSPYFHMFYLIVLSIGLSINHDNDKIILEYFDSKTKLNNS